MSRRIEKLLEKLNIEALDAIIVTNLYNIRYLSGFTGSSAALYISNNTRVIITDFRYIEQATKQCPGYEVVDQAKLSVFATLKQIIIKDNVLNIGFEEATISYINYIKIKEELEALKLIGTKNLIEEVRMVKEDCELENIKMAARIADNAFNYILTVIRPGITERKISLELEFYMKNNKAEGLSFDTIVASGKNSSLCHAKPSDKKIEKGDLLTMDFGCAYKGYCSDMTRTIVVGKANDKQKEIYNTVLKAQLEALNVLKSGLTGKEVDAIARNIIEKAGYGKYFGHGLGHSVGLEIHESPRLSYNEDRILTHNMIATIEPGIYIPDFGGVRIEDLVCIKEKGYENYTISSKRLIEL